ncbi:MAG: LPS assembly lipoprotein LptE [Campylobacteraceae bacterium]|jgi:uncharacterized protein YcfL|nr:LPS assembly lipoprotein LptE [Campylobacteraceae bacterium]
MRKISISFLFAFLLVGCGYTPTAKLAQNVIGERVYVEVEISRVDPQNTVLIRDAVTSALMNRFNSVIVDKNLADTVLYTTLLNTKFQAIAYDINGYVISYRTVVTLKTNYEIRESKTKGSLTTKGEYDFPIVANSVISDAKRFEAIKFASESAIDEFLAVVAIKGLQNNKE